MRVVSEVDSTVRWQLGSGSQRGAPTWRCLRCRIPKRRNPGRLPKQGRFRGFEEAVYSVTAPAPRTAYDVSVVANRLTAARMGPYLDDSAGDATAALRLYDWNSAVGGAMHADLGRLEVVFRNAVDMALKNLGASRAWAQPWYVQESLFRGRKGEAAREAITTAMHRASRRQRRAPAHGGVIAELGFGFWRFLCGPAYLTALWVPALASAFPHHPAQGDPRRIRAEVEHRMERLHLLRNRIAHHEPIFRRDLERDHNLLLELIGWMCVDSRTWVAAVSRTPETIAERPR